MSKLERIASFIVVAEEQSFAAAARKKNLSVAAISRQIAALEAELGTQLLQRNTRRTRLTKIGESYYQQCKKSLTELYDAELAITHNKNEATGTLNIIANRYFAMSFLLPRLAEFISLNPKLKIYFQLSERFPDFDNEEIDILFGFSIEGPQELKRRRIATTRYVLCAAPKYFKKNGMPQSPSDLIRHHYITHSIRRPDNVIIFKNNIEIMLTPFLRLNDSYAMRECAIQGMGIVNLHDYMVNDAIQDGRLIQIMSEYQEVKKEIYLYYQQNRYLQPKIRKFIDFYTL